MKHNLTNKPTQPFKWPLIVLACLVCFAVWFKAGKRSEKQFFTKVINEELRQVQQRMKTGGETPADVMADPMRSYTKGQ